MRGKVPKAPRHLGRGGITPAYAGKRELAACCGFHHGDHPRVCGEKGWQTTLAKHLTGSPPRMRGKGFAHSVINSDFGITPAYAGKSKHYAPTCRLRRDHPRVCGEKHKRPCACLYSGGSPPRMRGKVHRVHQELCRVGITPAYAGKSFTSVFTSLEVQDHPRVCGEKRTNLSTSPVIIGSPPRMRGKADEC